MVNDNPFGEDFFDDEEYLNSFNAFNEEEKQDIKDFLEEQQQQEGIDLMEDFEKLAEQYIDDPEGNGGKLLESISFEKDSNTYTKEVWLFGDVKVNKIILDIKRTVEEQEDIDKKRYTDYLRESLSDIRQELNKAVYDEDYERAAELANRIKIINEFLDNAKH
jgi:ATP-dependent Lon protease